jgi:hypothetical protein
MNEGKSQKSTDVLLFAMLWLQAHAIGGQEDGK